MRGLESFMSTSPVAGGVQLYWHLDNWLREHLVLLNPAWGGEWGAAALAGRPFVKDGAVHLSAAALRAHVARYHDRELEMQDLVMLLRLAGWTAVKLRVRVAAGEYHQVRVWRAPEGWSPSDAWASPDGKSDVAEREDF